MTVVGTRVNDTMWRSWGGMTSLNVLSNRVSSGVRVAWIAVALMSWAPIVHSQESKPRTIDPMVINATDFGPRYVGILTSGMGLGSEEFGLKAGEFVIQPRFFLETAFSSNFFRVDTRDEEELGVFSLHLRPGLAVFNPEYDVVSLNVKIDGDVMVPLTEDEAAFAQTNMGVRADVGATFFPRGIVSFSIEDRFVRSLWTNPALTEGEDAGNSNRNHNSLGADVAFHPGGRAIDISLGYRWRVLRFDERQSQDRDDHHLRLLATWRFYPLTYAFLETTFDVVDYMEETQPGGNHIGGMPVRVYLGMSGYITERFALLGRVGYGNTLLDTEAPGEQPEDFNSVVAQLRATYRFTPKTVLHVGASRNFDMAAFGGYRAYWRAYTTFEQQIGDLVLIHADIHYDNREFGRWQPSDLLVDPESEGGPSLAVTATKDVRRDDVLRAGLLVDFNISRLFGLSLGYRFEGIFTDYALSQERQVNDAEPSVTHYGYNEHRVFLTFNLRY